MSDTAPDTGATETITVYADYVCPFCYLGRASLSQYQERREQPLAVDWHPFDLQAGNRGPDGEIDHGVDDGKDEEYYEQARENVERLREEYDVEMAETLRRDVDSLPAQIVSYALRERADYEDWLVFDTGVYDALWTEGRDIGDPDVLADVAESAGFDPAVVEEILADDEARAAVTERFDEARGQGVTGVPTFVYDGHAARGAVPPDHLERLVDGV